MSRSVDDAKDFAEIDSSVAEMPKIRGNYGSTKPVQQLMDAISDDGVHRVVNVGDEKNRERWSRRLRYAAKKLNKEISIVYSGEGNSESNPPGLYFKGYNRGEAPTRGRRTKAEADSIVSQDSKDFDE